ncbi:MAG: hypothetical protein ACK46L_12470 [Synechococcaceae cyanobacterium]|jgi:hypothetical protein
MNVEGSSQGQAVPLNRRIESAGVSSSRPSNPVASLIPLLLLLLSLLDLRVEILLLIDHFTLTSFLQAISSHPLAITILVLQRSLWRRYRRR